MQQNHKKICNAKYIQWSVSRSNRHVFNTLS